MYIPGAKQESCAFVRSCEIGELNLFSRAADRTILRAAFGFRFRLFLAVFVPALWWIRFFTSHQLVDLVAVYCLKSNQGFRHFVQDLAVFLQQALGLAVRILDNSTDFISDQLRRIVRHLLVLGN